MPSPLPSSVRAPVFLRCAATARSGTQSGRLAATRTAWRCSRSRTSPVIQERSTSATGDGRDDHNESRARVRPAAQRVSFPGDIAAGGIGRRNRKVDALPARFRAGGHFATSGPVSRILSGGLRRRDGHSSGTRVTARLKRPTRRFGAPSQRAARFPGRSFLFGLAPRGVCRARGITAAAVRSYRTFSPLPSRCRPGGMFSVALSVGGL